MGIKVLGAMLVTLTRGMLPPPHASQRGKEAAQALQATGVVLINDVPLEEFTNVAEETWQAAGYPGLKVGEYNSFGSVLRPMLATNVYDVSAGAPGHLPAWAHSEQAYLFHVPRFAAFICLESADKGGELQLFNNVQLGINLGSLMDKFAKLGVTYYRVLGDQVNSPNWTYATGMWQQRLHTDDWPFAQRMLSANATYGGPKGADLRKFEQGLVRMNWTVPVVTQVNTSSTTGISRAILLAILDNHASHDYASGPDQRPSESATKVPAGMHSTWGDGSEFSKEELDLLQAASDESLEVEVLMKPGQIVIVDNWLYAHGRSTYEGARQHAALISDRFPRIGNLCGPVTEL